MVIDQPCCKTIDESVEKIVGIIHKSSHYAVMEIKVRTRVEHIYDGLGIAPLLTWSQHIINKLQMYELASIRATINSIKD
jgi:hypothetical protein